MRQAAPGRRWTWRRGKAMQAAADAKGAADAKDGAQMSGIRLSMRVWDAPTRLFHWLIVLLVACSWYTGEYGPTNIHFLSGYCVLTLLLFRIGWGFFGSDTARFGRFLQSPLAALRHLAHFARREPDREIGHNAAGGWMVVVMLLLLLGQVGTGLFSNDDFNDAPLSTLIDKHLSDQISGIHGKLIWVILGVIGLHVLAVVCYAIFKRHDLVRPMVTGKKRLPAAMRAPRMKSPLLALVWFALCAVAVWVLVTLPDGY
jgi:cytochrome b